MNTSDFRSRLRVFFFEMILWFYLGLVAVNSADGSRDGVLNQASGKLATNVSHSIDPIDLAGKSVDPFETKAKTTVLIFLNPECPISNRYAPEIQRLAKTFESKGAAFWLVYPDKDLLPAQIRKHTNEFGYALQVLRDPQHVLVKRTHARVTPEAAVFAANGQLIYHGRIDDRYVDFGKERVAPTQHDLEKAVEACLAGKVPESQSTQAIGCYISE